ncbi:MAG: glycosyltransferase family 2 protein [Bacteroidota bacterium]
MTVLEYIALAIGAISLLALLATYVLYPAVMGLLSLTRTLPWRRDNELLPMVTMVVAAYNEAVLIEEKIKNFLAIDYPEDRLFLAIGSDGSSDGTNEILNRFDDGRRIRAFSFERGGKMKTVNRVVAEVDTPFLVFSDANTMYEPQAIRRLLRNFADEKIGGVCGNLRLHPVNESVGGAGESTYWTFENLIKRWEGNVVTTLGATGGIYAIRRELYEQQPESMQVADDFLLPLRILGSGFRFVYDAEALAFEGTEQSMKHEFRRKIRVGIGTLNTMRSLAPILRDLPTKVRLMLFAHKQLRWAAPFFILALLIVIPLLSAIAWVQWYLFFPMLAFLLLAAAGWGAEAAGRRLGLLSLPFYFMTINTALFIAWFRIAQASRAATWERPTR